MQASTFLTLMYGSLLVYTMSYNPPPPIIILDYYMLHCLTINVCLCTSGDPSPLPSLCSGGYVSYLCFSWSIKRCHRILQRMIKGTISARGYVAGYLIHYANIVAHMGKVVDIHYN